MHDLQLMDAAHCFEHLLPVQAHKVLIEQGRLLASSPPPPPSLASDGGGGGGGGGEGVALVSPGCKLLVVIVKQAGKVDVAIFEHHVNQPLFPEHLWRDSE